MAMLIQKFLIRARRNGLSPALLGLGYAVLLVVSAALSGVEGVLFTTAVGLAFLLGTASRSGTFHLHSLATVQLAQPVDRATLLTRIEADADRADRTGQALCIVLQLDDQTELAQRHGKRAAALITRRIAERLQGEIRHNDTLADLADGRFCLYFAHSARIDLETAIQTTLRLQTAIMRPVAVDGLRLLLTASIGFCVTARLATGPDAPGLLQAAELALQTAQRDAPRAIRSFDRTMVSSAAELPKPGGAADTIGAALTNGDILPWYQPQICADTGALTGVEALARWKHTDRGTLTPAAFLPAILADGLSSKLTDTILAQSLEQLVAWDSAGVDVPRVSVNLGTEDLTDPTLTDRISWALDRHGLPATRLGLEVLETVVACIDPDAVIGRNLLALRRLGCFLDLDDFGTGSASINGIRRFGVNRIKIDRSLVTCVDRDRDQHAMISAILTMAQQLGVDVLAEGVETPGEFSTLAQLGCGHVQGYAIARPMPGSALQSWLVRRGVGHLPDDPHGQPLGTGKFPRRSVPQGKGSAKRLDL